MMRATFAIVALVALAGYSAAELSANPTGDAIAAAQGLVERLLGANMVPKFSFSLMEPAPGNDGFAYDVFTIDSEGGGAPVSLSGNSGVSLASALNWYLKYACNASVSWGVNGSGDQLSLPSVLPAMRTGPIVSPVKWRYAWNVCTVSYSAAFWDFSRWQREIDWMALQGYNMPLSFTGQEFVWRALFTSIGLTEAEIDEYFSGPAFFAWQRMGNIQGWGGPLTDSFINAQHMLQLQILNLTRNYGMINVLPGFSGHLPASIRRIYPNANLTLSAPWGGFNRTYTGVALLEPTDPLFVTLGSQFYKILMETYGTDHFYNSDTYNEMDPSSADPSFLAASNKAVFTAMTSADPDATYVMQAWLFHSSFWSPPRVEAYLSAIPNNSMLILDLNADETPLWKQYNSFYGKPFAWCMLHNYGGRRGIYGNLTRIATGPVDDLSTPGITMVATGITPEAIEQNPVIYELMSEMGWRSTSPPVDEWVQYYVSRRYGAYSPSAQAAWSLLLNGVYDVNDPDTSIIELAPAVGLASSTNTNATALTEAWRLLTQAAQNNEVNVAVGPFRYDLVDIGRQVLSNIFADGHGLSMAAFQRYQFLNLNSSASVASTSAFLLGILEDLDTLLGSDVNFLLGTWQSAARAYATTPDELPALEFNARNQLTLWGLYTDLSDYAAKHWNGLMGDYYYARWQMLLTRLEAAVQSGQPMDFDQYLTDLYAWEVEWNYDDKTFPSAPVGDAVALSASLLAKYATPPSAPARTYTKYADSDAPCTGCDLTRAWTTDVAQLQLLCNTDPTCAGFVSTGYLKNSTTTKTSSPGNDLYVKNV